ncbi:MAG TPA: STAS domain-containing protein [Actinomycetota bacterium]|nr:STAS domain-containing protein [Actinomycetota bacterium]
MARLDIMTEMGMMAGGMKHPLLSVSGEQRGHAAHLHVSGEIDLATAPVLEGWLDTAERNGNRAIVVDLEHVTFIDASGLRAFLHAAQRASLAGRTLELTNAPAVVRRVLQLTGCTHLLAADPLAQSPYERKPAPLAAQTIVARPSIQ